MPRHHRGNQTISGRIVFDQCRAIGQRDLQSGQGKIRRSLQCGVLPFVRRQFPKRSQQLILVGYRFFVQLLQAFGRVVLGPQLLQLDAVVIPVQFFPQIANSPHQFALPGISHWQALAALKNHFGHAAGFGGLDAVKGLASIGFRGLAAHMQVH